MSNLTRKKNNVLVLLTLLISVFAYANGSSESSHGAKKEQPKSPTKIPHCVFTKSGESLKKSCSAEGVRCAESANSSCTVKTEHSTYFGQRMVVESD